MSQQTKARQCVQCGDLKDVKSFCQDLNGRSRAVCGDCRDERPKHDDFKGTIYTKVRRDNFVVGGIRIY